MEGTVAFPSSASLSAAIILQTVATVDVVIGRGEVCHLVTISTMVRPRSLDLVCSDSGQGPILTIHNWFRTADSCRILAQKLGRRSCSMLSSSGYFSVREIASSGLSGRCRHLLGLILLEPRAAQGSLRPRETSILELVKNQLSHRRIDTLGYLSHTLDQPARSELVHPGINTVRPMFESVRQMVGHVKD